ncbi:MAG: alpha/beta hydrolase [Acidobacteriota bacterium]
MRFPLAAPARSRLAAAALAAGILSVGTGCAAFERLGMRVLFDPTAWPEDRVIQDVAYVDGADGADGADADKQKLDLFLPAPDAGAEPWPTLIFVHGGSWRQGDKDLAVGGREVYGNIGRFYASKGLGVAVISYRLQPGVTWRDQVDDVASSVRRVSELAAEHGGDPDSLFLSGHSAGAQLASFAAVGGGGLDETERRRICGVVAVSGAGYDLEDEQTYRLGADPAFYEETFRIDAADVDWMDRASVVARLGEIDGPPPFLVFYAGRESQALHRQAKLLHAAVEAAGASSRLVEVPGLGHRRIVVELSQADAVLPGSVLDFVAEHRGCGAPPAS